jgi:hypothetical protein
MYIPVLDASEWGILILENLFYKRLTDVLIEPDAALGKTPAIRGAIESVKNYL